nr:hypothetical protein BaRGS_004497 [Batillaria attramentaria]
MHGTAPVTGPSTVRTQPLGATNVLSNDAEDDEFDDASDGTLDDDKWSDYQTLKLAIDPHQKHLLDRLTSGELPTEFKKLPAGLKYHYTEGDREENKDKNRFKRIIPYDHSRVVLTKEGSDPFSDYINANYIKDYSGNNAYIATQGPLPNTVADFWRMVWQEHVTQIVMLTNLTEKMKPKCYQYWPEKGQQKKHGGITVTGVDVQLRADFFTRTFRLKTATGVQTVTQYQMTVWPDHGVPTAFSLVNLWRYIKTRTVPNTGPLLVHCSAGVGRTGTYIALDIAMDVLLQQRQNNVDIFSIASKLRQDRVIMIQAVDQYVFLHEALLEAYTSRDTRLQLDSFDVIFPQGVRTDKSDPRTDTEYKSLSQMKNFLSKPKYTTANKAENKGLNRTPSILPDDSHVVYLSVHVPGRNQYINAVSMPSFRQQTGMLLTQLPLSDTITDMWRLVEGFNVATIVSISAKEEEKKQKKSSRPYDVRVLHYNAWDDAVPEVTSDLLHLLELLDTSHHDVTDRPFIVQCWDGATKSGLFCALYNVISRMTYDREVDVYLTARHVQSIRAEAISSQVQYRYCYHVVQEYKKAFDVYANS